MFNYFLNRLPIDEPQGLPGLYLSKKANSKFHGFLTRSLGQTEGVGQVSFSNPRIVKILDLLYRENYVDASCSFEIVAGKTTVLSTDLDFATYKRQQNSRSVALIDTQSDALHRQADKSVSVAAKTPITLGGAILAGGLSFSVPSDKSLIESRVSGSIAHIPPLKAGTSSSDQLTGSVFDPTVENRGLIYTNTTSETRLVDISLFLPVDILVGSDGAFSVLLSVAGNSFDQITTLYKASFTLNRSQSLTIAAQQTVSVPPGASVSLRVAGTDVSNYSFKYGTGNLTLNDDNAPASVAGAIAVYDALNFMISTLTDNAFTFQSDYFLTGPGKDFYLTSGLNIRGVESPLILSLEKLFVDLDCLFDLFLDYEQNTVRVEPKAYLYQQLPTPIPSVAEVLFEPALNKLPATLKIGFSTWHSSTANGTDDLHASAEYSTRFKRSSTSIDLTCKTFAASSSLIESIRRTQFRPGAKTDQKEDEQIFIIHAPNKFAAVESGRYNNELTPERTLRNHESENAHQYPLTLSVATGGLSSHLPQSIQAEANPISTGDYATVGCVMDTPEFTRLGRIVQFADLDGAVYRMLLESAIHRPFKRENEPNTYLTGNILL